MPAAVYPLLLLMVVYVHGAAFFKSELFGHALLLAFAMALMLIVRHYWEIYVRGLAIKARWPWARYFLANSAIPLRPRPGVDARSGLALPRAAPAVALYAAATAIATSGLTHRL